MSIVRGGWPGACLLLLAGGVSAAPPPAAPGVADLQHWDDRQTHWHHTLWLLYGGTAAVGADERGRTLAQDVNEWVADAATGGQLRELRRRAGRAGQAGDARAARASLDAAEQLLATAERRLAVVSGYWSLRLAVERQRQLWLQWLALAPGDMATASRQHVDALEALVRRDYVPDANIDTVLTDLHELLHGYDIERGKLAAYVSEHRDHDRGSDRVLRRVPCPEPVLPPQTDSGAAADSPTSVDQRVRIRRSVDLANYYPDQARRAEISGKTVLRLSIDATGCERQAEVIQSSGAPELDAAAVQVVEDMRFYPAQQHGKLIASQPSIPIKFELHPGGTEAPTPAADAAGKGSASDAPQTAASSESQQARRLLTAGDAAGARAALDALLAREPENVDALLVRSEAYRVLGQPDKALRDATQAVRLRPNAPGGYLQSGLALVDQHKYDDSIGQLSRALELDPRNDWVLANRGMAYALKQDAGHASADIEAAYALNPRNYVALHGRAVLARQSQDMVAAIKNYSAALQVYPQDVWALRQRAAAHWLLGEDALALADAEALVQQRPKSADSYLVRAQYRGRLDLPGRTADVAAALALQPRSTAALRLQARLHLEQEDYVGAIKTLTDAIDAGSDNPSLRLQRAIAYERNSQSDLAQQDIVAARAAARTADAHNQICWELALAGVALDDALQECETAVVTGHDPTGGQDAAAEREPGVDREPALLHDAAYLDSRGMVLYRLRRYDEAIASYDAALAMRPKQASSLYGRGLARRARGDEQAGAADIQAALDLNHHVADDIPADPAAAGARGASGQ